MTLHTVHESGSLGAVPSLRIPSPQQKEQRAWGVDVCACRGW